MTERISAVRSIFLIGLCMAVSVAAVAAMPARDSSRRVGSEVSPAKSARMHAPNARQPVGPKSWRDFFEGIGLDADCEQVEHHLLHPTDPASAISSIDQKTLEIVAPCIRDARLVRDVTIRINGLIEVANAPADQVHLRIALGTIQQNSGHPNAARQSYEQALKDAGEDPTLRRYVETEFSILREVERAEAELPLIPRTWIRLSRALGLSRQHELSSSVAAIILTVASLQLFVMLVDWFLRSKYLRSRTSSEFGGSAADAGASLLRRGWDFLVPVLPWLPVLLVAAPMALWPWAEATVRGWTEWQELLAGLGLPMQVLYSLSALALTIRSPKVRSLLRRPRIRDLKWLPLSILAMIVFDLIVRRGFPHASGTSAIVAAGLGVVGQGTVHSGAVRVGLALLASILSCVGEETLYRGWVIYVRGDRSPRLMRDIFSVVLFSCGHVAGGWLVALRTAVMGIAAVGMTESSECLWGALILHTLLNIRFARIGLAHFGI